MAVRGGRPAAGGGARTLRCLLLLFFLGLLLLDLGGQPRRAAEPRAGSGRLQLEPGAARPVDGGVVSSGLRGAPRGAGVGLLIRWVTACAPCECPRGIKCPKFGNLGPRLLRCGREQLAGEQREAKRLVPGTFVGAGFGQ